MGKVFEAYPLEHAKTRRFWRFFSFSATTVVSEAYRLEGVKTRKFWRFFLFSATAGVSEAYPWEDAKTRRFWRFFSFSASTGAPGATGESLKLNSENLSLKPGAWKMQKLEGFGVSLCFLRLRGPPTDPPQTQSSRKRRTKRQKLEGFEPSV